MTDLIKMSSSILSAGVPKPEPVTIVIRRGDRDLVTINTSLPAPVAAEIIMRELGILENK